MAIIVELREAKMKADSETIYLMCMKKINASLDFYTQRNFFQEQGRIKVSFLKEFRSKTEGVYHQ